MVNRNIEEIAFCVQSFNLNGYDSRRLPEEKRKSHYGLRSDFIESSKCMEKTKKKPEKSWKSKFGERICLSLLESKMVFILRRSRFLTYLMLVSIILKNNK